MRNGKRLHKRGERKLKILSRYAPIPLNKSASELDIRKLPSTLEEDDADCNKEDNDGAREVKLLFIHLYVSSAI